MITLFRTAIAGLAIGLCLSAQAQQFATEPAPGLWRSEFTSLINGRDIIAAVREAQQEMLAQLPPDQRALVAAMLEGEEMAVENTCLSPDDVAQLRSPELMLANIREEMPGCALQLAQAGRDRMRFTGTCENFDGFTGDLGGEVILVSAREIHRNFEGKGVYDTGGEELPPGMADLDGKVEMQHQEISEWVAGECP